MDLNARADTILYIKIYRVKGAWNICQVHKYKQHPWRQIFYVMFGDSKYYCLQEMNLHATVDVLMDRQTKNWMTDKWTDRKLEISHLAEAGATKLHKSQNFTHLSIAVTWLVVKFHLLNNFSEPFPPNNKPSLVSFTRANLTNSPR